MNTAMHIIEKHVWKRLGVVGFAFFLVKGMIWLAVPVAIYLMGAVN